MAFTVRHLSTMHSLERMPLLQSNDMDVIRLWLRIWKVKAGNEKLLLSAFWLQHPNCEIIICKTQFSWNTCRSKCIQ